MKCVHFQLWFFSFLHKKHSSNYGIGFLREGESIPVPVPVNPTGEIIINPHSVKNTPKHIFISTFYTVQNSNRP